MSYISRAAKSHSVEPNKTPVVQAGHNPLPATPLSHASLGCASKAQSPRQWRLPTWWDGSADNRVVFLKSLLFFVFKHIADRCLLKKCSMFFFFFFYLFPSSKCCVGTKNSHMQQFPPFFCKCLLGQRAKEIEADKEVFLVPYLMLPRPA